MWAISILRWILKPLDTIEWLFDEKAHPTLAKVEAKFFEYVNTLECWLNRLDSSPEGVKWLKNTSFN